MITTLIEDLLALAEKWEHSSSANPNDAYARGYNEALAHHGKELRAVIGNHYFPPAPTEKITREEPDLALLISMANRMNHGFFTLSQKEQEQLLSDMRRCWDEVTGHGFYREEHKKFYLDQLKK